MSETESGNKDLEVALESLLDEFDRSIKLNQATAPREELGPFLVINRDEIAKYDPEECLEVSIILTQYAIFLQRVMNREVARLKACTTQINRLCARHWNSYDKYTPKEIKYNLICAEESRLEKMLKLQTRIEAYIAEIEGLATLVKACSDNWKELGKVKTYGNRS